ncbi:MAG: hypothetical protein A2218_07860 [Elusimicrobia bacterium RIFOXYA2_FULL_53_38]|nr:MAG: hypothetical protein A2218_07860 [Elusimicrobia bacterium RIFOXYA2_FULL_53_38]
MAIFKKQGVWWIDYRVDGRRLREKVGPTWSLAKEVLHRRLKERSENKFFPERTTNNTTFQKIADKYVELHGQYLKSRTWQWMLPKINAAFGKRKVTDIKPGEIQQFYNEITDRTSTANATRHLVVISAIFNKALAWGDFYGRNPCIGVRKGPQAANRMRYLTLGEIRILLKSAPPRLYPVLVCALLTGMRRGEILNLRWEHIDLERGIIYILQSKSGRPREIPMASQLRDELLTLGPMESGVIFPLPVITLCRLFKKTINEASISGFRFHDTRHTFASHYIMRTHDLPALQGILGHSTPAMTMRYAHLSSGHLAANMKTFESAIPIKPQISAPILTLDGHPGGHQAISAIP